MDRVIDSADTTLAQNDIPTVHLSSEDLIVVDDISNLPDADIQEYESGIVEEFDDLFVMPEDDISDVIRIIDDLPDDADYMAQDDFLNLSEKPDLKKMRLYLESDETASEDIPQKDVEAAPPPELPDSLNGISFDNIDSADKGEVNDYALLYETENELIRAADKHELFDIILFSLIGHLGCSSASLIFEETLGSGKWTVALSKGIRLDTEGLFFNANKGFIALLREKKGVIDIDDYKDDNKFIDEYMECLSLDGRYMAPVMYNDELTAAVLLSDRLDRAEYDAEDISFIISVCETAGIVLNRLLENEKLNAEITGLKSSLDKIKDIESLEEQLVCEGTLGGMTQIIREEFRKYGIESYAVFARSRQSDTLSLVITEENSQIGLKNSEVSFEEQSQFVKFIGKSGRVVDVEGFRQSAIVKQVFTNEQIRKMSMFRIYPYLSSGRNIGFTLIFRLSSEANIQDIDMRMQKISRFIFNAFYLIQDVDADCSRYTDNMEAVYKRINHELVNANELDIPLTLLLFSIKNFKRYYNLLGEERANTVLFEMEKNIRGRLSDSDFSVRYGRSSFLMVLPGKDKKLALQLGAAIRNSIKQDSGEEGVSLLMTFLAAQYPDDGSDLFTLLDLFE